MNHAIVMNVLITVVVLVGLLILQNPLFILGFMFLVDLPYGLHPSQTNAVGKDNNDDDEPQAMGFTQDVK